jgi:hypothetical protein
MTTALLNLGIPDIIHTCPNDNSTSSCMNIGIASGYQAGKDTKENQLAYSLVGGVGEQHSPNFSYGYLLGYDQGFGVPTNSSFIVSVANKTGFEDGINGASIEPPSCTVNNLWCSTYDSGYRQGYTAGQLP